MVVARSCIALCVALAAPAPGFAVEAGSPAPDVAFAALHGSTAPARLSALRGRVVYVDFWASWCAPCVRSFPALRALQDRHREQGLVVVGVNKDMAAADAQRFLRRFPASFALAADTNDVIARAFDVKTMPSGYLIDRAGVVRHVHRGFTAETETALARDIQSLLQEKP